MADRSISFALLARDFASPTFDRVARAADNTGRSFSKLSGMTFTAVTRAVEGLAVAAAVVGTASIKMAMDFDQQMARLNTQAHVPAAAVKDLSNQVLGLAGQVGFGPKSLAEALYHVESSFASTGITSKKAMDILKAAAQGAAIGGANLVDTQNALDAAVVSGIKGVENYQQAMGALNATVGAGDMSMQDLADAMGTGVLAVIKNYGVTLNDASAALATFGDNNIRGADAGTALRMAVQSLAVPAAKGADLLKSIGLNAHSLAVDMQHGGLNQALQDLNKRMTDAGITGSKVGDFLTESFGKKAGVGLALLIGQFDRFESKYAEADKGAHQFAQDWQAQQQQFSQVLKDLEAGAEAVGVRIGNFLIPKVMQFGKAIGDAWHSLNQQAGGQQSILKEFMTGFNNPGMTNFDSGFGGALEKIGVAVHKLDDEAHKLWSALAVQLKPVFRDVSDFVTNSLVPALGHLWDALSPTIHRALVDVGHYWHLLGDVLKNVVGPALRDVTKWMADHQQVMHDFVDVTVALFSAWAGYTVWTEATAAAQRLTGSIEALKAASATPAGKIGWIAGIAVGLFFLYKDVETFRHGLEGFAGDIISWGDGVLVVFKAVGDDAFTTTQTIIDGFARLPGPLGAPFKKVKRDVDDMKSTFDQRMQGMIEDTDRAKNHFYDLSKGIHDSTVSTDALKKSVDSLPNKQLVVDVIDHASSILSDIHNAAAGLINLGFTPQGATNTVKASGYADGGLISGSGGPRQDNHLIRVSSGETVVPAHLTPKYAPFFARDGIPGFADGGLVYDATPTVQNMGNILHSGLSSGGNAPGGMSAGSAVNLGRMMAAAVGWVGAMFDALNKLWTRESGWNPNAVNPSSGAYGIPQSLGHGHPYNLGDAGAQIAWGLQYIAGRYGNPINAWAHEVSAGWYDQGGFLPPGTSVVHNNTGKPEPVLTSEQWARVQGGTTIVIQALDSADVARFINRPGNAQKLIDGLDRHKARGSSVPDWMN